MSNDVEHDAFIAELNSVYNLVDPGDTYWESLKLTKTKDILSIQEFGVLLLYNYKKEKYELSGVTPTIMKTKLRYLIQKKMSKEPEFKRRVIGLMG